MKQRNVNNVGMVRDTLLKPTQRKGNKIKE